MNETHLNAEAVQSGNGARDTFHGGGAISDINRHSAKWKPEVGVATTIVE